MSHYSDPQHALLAKIAKGIEELTKTIHDTPSREGTLLAQTLAENIRLKESLDRVNQELLQMRMDATQDPILRAVFIEQAKEQIGK
jgi:hypothetical protein